MTTVAELSSDMLVHLYYTIWHYTSEDCNLHSQGQGNKCLAHNSSPVHKYQANYTQTHARARTHTTDREVYLEEDPEHADFHRKCVCLLQGRVWQLEHSDKKQGSDSISFKFKLCDLTISFTFINFLNFKYLKAVIKILRMFSWKINWE